MKKIIMTEPVLVEEYFNSLQAFKLRNAADYLLMEEEALKEDLIFNQEMIEKGYIALEADGEGGDNTGSGDTTSSSSDQEDSAAEKARKKADKARRKAEKQKEKNKKEKGVGNRIGRFIQKILDWISNLFGNYEKNTKKSIKKNEKWVKENLDKIKNVDDKFWSEYYIDFEPYYGTDIIKIQDKFKNNIYTELNLKAVNADGSGFTAKVDNGFDEKKDLLKEASETLFNYNKEEPNFVEAAKAYYRGRYSVKEGNVRYRGDSFKKVILAMADYVKQYGNVAKEIGKELKMMDNICKKIAEKAQSTEGAKQINLNSAYGIDKFDQLLYSIIEEDYLWNIPRYKKIVENSHIILEETKVVDNKEKTSSGVHQEEDSKEKEKEKIPEQTTSEKDKVKAFTNRLEYVKIILSVMTARMTIAEECYNKSFNCLNKVLNMAHDNKFLNEPITEANPKEEKEEKKGETDSNADKQNKGSGGDNDSGSTEQKGDTSKTTEAKQQ